MEIFLFNFDACSGDLVIRNSVGEVTIELDAETGNIYYSGELIKRLPK